MSNSTIRVPSNWGAGAVLLFIGTIAGFLLGRLTAPTTIIESQKSLKRPETASDSEEERDEEVNDFKDLYEEQKLVLVVRTDLGMTKGKIAAQCSHATLACYKSLMRSGKTDLLDRWESRGQAKVSVQVKSEDELLMLQAQARSLGICAKIIHDAGRTQIASGSATVLGVGPGPKSMVDQVTGPLKLL